MISARMRITSLMVLMMASLACGEQAAEQTVTPPDSFGDFGVVQEKDGEFLQLGNLLKALVGDFGVGQVKAVQLIIVAKDNKHLLKDGISYDYFLQHFGHPTPPKRGLTSYNVVNLAHIF